MRIFAPHALMAALVQLSCIPAGASSGPVGTTNLTAASLKEDLDDTKIIAVVRRMLWDQRVLGELAQNHADSASVHEVAQQLIDDSATSPPLSARRHSKLEDELAGRDAEVTLRLSRFAGSSFDHEFIAAQHSLVTSDLDLIRRTLLPAAVDPGLVTELERVEATFSRQLLAIEATETLDAAHGAP